MASPAVMSTVLQTLPPRPPTPPRETIPELEIQTRQLDISSTLQPPASSLHTPPSAHSPASGGSTSRRKRVGFSAQAQFQEPPVYPDDETKRVPTPVSLPSSASKPVKSILKATPGPNPLRTSTTSLELSDSNVKLCVMLDSTIQQLAGADRDSRVDAYIMLVRALKASNNLPDRVALQEKMGLFMQFMLRDITAKSPTGTIDSPLVNQALNLLITFLSFPAIASTVTSDFAMSIIDHCIRSFEDVTMPKEVTRHLMQVVVAQNFSTTKVMTSDRVARLVSAVRKIEGHLKGKSIMMSRVLIYTKLVKQCRHLMAVHSEWLLDLFADMLSQLKDIRTAAINLGLEAGFTVGKEKNISRKVMEIFNQTNEEKRYIDFYQERLRMMCKEKTDKTDSAAVPQIWSVIALFLRCPMDKWDGFSSWLKIIQLSFNTIDVRTKIEANIAWSRLAYVMLMDDRSYAKALPILTQPLVAQLKRKSAPFQQVAEFRDAVVGGVRHLLYYTFRPNANLQLLDSQWDSGVKPLVEKLLDSPAAVFYDGTFHATAILAGLFDCVTPRVWNPERAIDKQLVQADELPAIDPKWLRRNAARVFKLVEPILLQDFASLSDFKSPTHRLWRNLVTAVASAASKEIKVSTDTAGFVAQSFNTLQKIWRQGPKEDTDSASLFLKATQTYLGVMIELLGLLPFTQNLLSVDKDRNFVPLATPTHRKNQAFVKSPLNHLFLILFAIPIGIQDDDNFASFFSSVFSPALAAKSDKGRKDLALELLSTVPMEVMMPFGPWKFTADVVSSWLESGHSSLQSTGPGADTPVGHEYRDIVRILERGLRSTPNLPWNHWKMILQALIDRVRDETGEAGVAIAVIEPLAKIVLEHCTAGGRLIVSPSMARCTIELLSVAHQPRERQAVEAARRRLWGAGSRSASFDTFDHLYKIVNMMLNVFYNQGAANDGDIAALLKEVGNFLERCNPQLLVKSLVSFQAGLTPWIGDVLAETHRKPAGVDEAIKATWQQICNVLRGYDGLQQLPLDELGPLLCAAFKSKHRQIVNSSLALWNNVFEKVKEVQYPEKLKEVLLSLQPFVDITLPGLDVSSIESTGPEPMFVETQEDDIELPQLQPPRSSGKHTPQPSRANARSSSVGLSVPAKRLQERTPEVRPSKAQRRSATPKLRHDNSQIQFAPIESSPLAPPEPVSQVLTDRQREVRERQKEVANLFPEIRSSPSRKVKASSRPSSRATSPQRLPTLRAATPEPRKTVEEFIASTPTPRRGQVVALHDQDSDMAEPPSSPPEPRRNPLAKEIQSRSASQSLMEEWQFSSSPAGSPAPAPHAIVESSQVDVDEFHLSDDDDSLADSHDKPEPELGESVIMESMIEDSVMVDDEPVALADSSALDLTASELGVPDLVDEAAAETQKEKSPTPGATAEAVTSTKPLLEVVPEDVTEAAPTTVPAAAEEQLPEAVEVAPQLATEVVADKSATKSVVPNTEDPSTPSHDRTIDHQEAASQNSAAAEEPATASSRRSSRRRSKTPRTQIKRTSSRRKSASSTPAHESFDGSEVDNSSFVRLVVELDGAKLNPAEYEHRQITESPDTKRLRELQATPKKQHTRSQLSRDNDALDCIVVSSPVKNDEMMVSAPIVEDEEMTAPEVAPSSQASSQGRRKRKRGGHRGSQAAAAVKRRKSLQGKSQEQAADEEGDVVDLTGVDSQSIASQSLGHSQDVEQDEDSQAANNDALDNVDLEVQSQIAQEAEASFSQERAGSELRGPGSERESVQPEESTEMHTAVERMGEKEGHMDVDATTSKAKEKHVGAAEKRAAPSAAELVPVQAAPEPEESPFQKIMSFIRGGIDALRGAALSRNEIYQLEDALRDARRELIDAEERGRERL